MLVASEEITYISIALAVFLGICIHSLWAIPHVHRSVAFGGCCRRSVGGAMIRREPKSYQEQPHTSHAKGLSPRIVFNHAKP